MKTYKLQKIQFIFLSTIKCEFSKNFFYVIYCYQKRRDIMLEFVDGKVVNFDASEGKEELENIKRK